MKSFIVFFIVLFSTVVQAETMYVGYNIKITVRTGPGINHKIVAMIRSGERVEVVKPEEEWSLVRITNGKEGWVLSRFLTANEPDELVLDRLKKKHKVLTIQAVSLIEENKVYKKENNKLNSELKTNEEMLNEIRLSYETLKKESAGFLELKSNYEKISSKLSEQTKKAEKLEEELTKLLLHQNIKWFLSGAGVLLLGFLIGFSAKRQRRRPSLL
ncbi:MAG: TIGR04211 family SH3 domain-containing protein [Proteobacteria bacterium]|nr:TIGR04211 family SH3 domain-containing protein [Pseudomonadota bacterium]MBU4289177.1 TIGR04211 family SH3 domain-containing protein [Pseudomonadota bacterium]MBU4414899.1 TIGR04211 family SH3 domain-containing protein [Pseudomonadota bacterium]MCG2758285.1 TIGR04211 family SH3 domain-containing protein [Desulfobacteraceae bacterium]